MLDRQHECTAVHYDLLPPHAGAYERTLLTGPQIEPMKEPEGVRDDDREPDQPQNKGSELSACHAAVSLICRIKPATRSPFFRTDSTLLPHRTIRLNPWVCSPISRPS